MVNSIVLDSDASDSDTSDSDDSIDLPPLSSLFRTSASAQNSPLPNSSMQRIANQDDDSLKVILYYRKNRGYVQVYDAQGTLIQSGEVSSTSSG
ncbi:hypothetical protein TNCV_1352241 [Trichonephila clavipes]|nr:hypothetical protein TNCV_1352241 [Trichonephila clavipes]